MNDTADCAFKRELLKGLWRENPVFTLVLGLCPALAVTNSLANGVVMGLASTFVLVGSSALISALRAVIPGPVRIATYIIIIATFVTAADFMLAAWLPTAHRQLGAFISLIVVNCIILGRAEAFASRNTVWLSVADAVGMAGGFTLVLSLVGGIRGLLGSGTLGGVQVFGDRFEPWAVMKLPPGGFLTLGVLLVGLTWAKEKLAQRRAR
ncbi:MAG: electron transport complex subunit RsxE [Deltaproteobacteria bacterium]|nr:electron transport complex subunit RsxE [Deltaproteobacteria bacterium]